MSGPPLAAAPGMPDVRSAALVAVERGPSGGLPVASSLAWCRHWRHECGQAANDNALELQTAKAHLVEIFLARLEDIEDMIQRRLVESWPEEREWPAAFSMESDHGQEL
jgi:hypothetical protein